MNAPALPALAAALSASIALSLGACAPAPTPRVEPLALPASASAGLVASSDAAPAPPPPRLPCASDDDCGYDVGYDRCDADPRLNKQPPMVDQGVICYCEDSSKRCERLRVWPVPCESDASCTVAMEPRPHPAAATPDRPHERGVRCRDYKYRTTCEHKNICLMHTLSCP